MIRSAVLVGAIVLGCADVATPDELDHARVLAVRADPPGIAAEQTSRLDVLATTDRAQLLQPVITRARIVGTDDTRLLERDAQGWTVTAPSENDLARLRQGFGLAETAPIPVFVELTVEIDDRLFVADKQVLLGQAHVNPSIVNVMADGQVVDQQMAIGRDREVSLTVETEPNDGLRYVWSSSVGELSSYRSPNAVLATDAAETGTVLVVARDERGGVDWRRVTAIIDAGP